MPTVDQVESVLNGNNLLIVLVVVLGLCIAIKYVGDAVTTLKAWKKPSGDRVAKLEEYSRNDKARLDGHETRLQALENSMHDTQTGQRVMMRGVVALLEHELHNGNSEQMQEASDNINRYLIDK